MSPTTARSPSGLPARSAPVVETVPRLVGAEARRTPADGPWRGEAVFAWTVVLLAGLTHFNLIWNHFYREVPYLFDAGWYGALVYRNAPLLENPAAVVFGEIGPRFYATHFSPGLWALSLPSWLAPLSMPVWLAMVEGAKHAAIAWVAWRLVRALREAGAPEPGGGGRAFASAAGAAFVLLAPFNGVLLACNVFPHFETWLAPLGLGFFLALHRGKTAAAAACLAGAVSIREDMGFHVCGLLLVMACLRGWRPWRRPEGREARRWLAFAAAGFAASVAGLLVMRLGFPGDRAFARVYLGEPPLAHVNAATLGERFLLIWNERAYLWAPAAVCGLWAALRRSWWPLAGYLAFAPWAVLHVFAASGYAGAMASYYGFPYALAVLWPAAGALFFARGERAGPTLAWAAALALVSILAFARGNDLGAALARLHSPAEGARPVIEGVVARLAGAVAEGEAVAVDDGVAAHAPRAFSRENLFWQTRGEPEIVAYYANGRQVREALEHAGRLPYLHRVAGTRIVVAADRPLGWSGLAGGDARDETEDAP